MEELAHTSTRTQSLKCLGGTGATRGGEAHTPGCGALHTLLSPPALEFHLSHLPPPSSRCVATAIHFQSWKTSETTSYPFPTSPPRIRPFQVPRSIPHPGVAGLPLNSPGYRCWASQEHLALISALVVPKKSAQASEQRPLATGWKKNEYLLIGGSQWMEFPKITSGSFPTPSALPVETRKKGNI